MYCVNFRCKFGKKSTAQVPIKKISKINKHTVLLICNCRVRENQEGHLNKFNLKDLWINFRVAVTFGEMNDI